MTNEILGSYSICVTNSITPRRQEFKENIKPTREYQTFIHSNGSVLPSPSRKKYNYSIRPSELEGSKLYDLGIKNLTEIGAKPTPTLKTGKRMVRTHSATLLPKENVGTQGGPIRSSPYDGYTNRSHFEKWSIM